MEKANSDEGMVMDLILEARTGHERVTMACYGKLVGGKEADVFRGSALLLMSGFDNLVIDLAGVRSMDCGGVGSLASVLGMAVDKGKQVQIANASPKIVQMLRVTKLDQFLERENRERPQGAAGHYEAVA
ncbi:MAG TPA: STAS domain-containing protein [Candidatus Saccharimonadales bacterium]|nr:STAS domain-containing protein [Candidatus Saccharimonadales bacterium]